MNIEEAAALIRARRLSSVELTDDSLRRIRELNPSLNAFITVMEDSARTGARMADEELAGGNDRGPLHGIPVALKDLFWTRGVRTTGGSKILANFVPECDANVVQRLIAAGAVIVGKTNMHELAYGVTSANPHYGPVRNPHDTGRIAGGSSGGSGAAVAAGMVFAALGTDTGGSIRIPASFCGCVGLKPTYGRVSRHGVTPLSFSQDHVGPLAATVRDCALVLNAISDPVELPGVAAHLGGMRIGMVECDRVSKLVREAVIAAGRCALELGAKVVPVSIPELEEINAVGRLILLAEASAAYAPYLHDRTRFGQDVLALLDQGRLIPATEYVNAQRLRHKQQIAFLRVWEQADVLMMPATPMTAPRIAEQDVAFGDVREDVRLAATRLVRPWDVLGVPAISLPGGFGPDGMPVGVQLVAPAFHEAGLFTAATAIEQAIG